MEKTPSVKTMLLDDPCGYITLPETDFYCQILDVLGVEKGLVYLLGSFEEFLIDLKNNYETSDKSKSENTKSLKYLYTKLPPFIYVLVNPSRTGYIKIDISKISIFSPLLLQ